MHKLKKYEGFRYFGEKAAFEHWFVSCVIEGAKNEDCPDSYVWDMKKQSEKGGYWFDMFRDGLIPSVAVSCRFSGLKLNG